MNELFGKSKTILQFIIGLSYLILGGFVIKKKWFLTTLDESIAWVLGVLLILYGLFRAYRALQIKKGESL